MTAKIHYLHQPNINLDVRLISIKKTIKARDEMTADKSIRNLFLYIEEL